MFSSSISADKVVPVDSIWGGGVFTGISYQTYLEAYQIRLILRRVNKNFAQEFAPHAHNNHTLAGGTGDFLNPGTLRSQESLGYPLTNS